MDSQAFPVFVAMMVAVAVGVLAYNAFFSRAARMKKKLRRQQLGIIRDAVDGTVVKVQGTVSYLGTPLEAPLSGRPCAMWEVHVEERGGRRKGWHTLFEDFQCQPFVLDDGTGKAVVKAVIPRLVLVKDAQFQSQTFQDATDRLERFLAEHGEQSVGLFGFNRTLRYSEGIIEAGERLVVMGAGHWEPDPDGIVRVGYRDAPQRLVVEDPQDGHLLISDDPDVLRDS
jgi:hypothetical protein